MDLFRNDPHRQDAYVRAKRVHDLLAPLRVVEDDSVVPSTSLLREFIGGSAYQY
jgi:uridine kinase